MIESCDICGGPNAGHKQWCPEPSETMAALRELRHTIDSTRSLMQQTADAIRARINSAQKLTKGQPR